MNENITKGANPVKVAKLINEIIPNENHSQLTLTRLSMFKSLFPIIFMLVSSLLIANEVNIYTSRHYDSDIQLYEKFTAKTGIKVNIVSGKDKALQKRITEEGADINGYIKKTESTSLEAAQDEFKLEAIEAKEKEKEKTTKKGRPKIVASN